MTTTDYTTTFIVANSPHEVYNSINKVAAWWQGEVEGETDKLNDEFLYRMKEHHFSVQKIVELIPDEKITWLVTDSKLNSFQSQDEWTGTKITFQISSINDKTQVRFTHLGLEPKIQCYGACSNAWGQLIQKSLFSLITTGKGINVF